MAENARYLVGDPIASIRMLDRDGRVVDYSHQSLAGRAIVLYLADGSETEEDWAMLGRALADVAGSETLAAIVTKAPGRTPRSFDDIAVLVDEEGESARAFGISTPAFVLVGPHSRLVSLVPGKDIAPIREIVLRSQNSTQRMTIARQAPVVTIDQVLEPGLCDQLIGYWRHGAKKADSVASAKRGNAQQIASIKRRGDVIVEDAEWVALLRQRMARRVLGEIRKVHHMEIVGHEAFRIGCYDSANQGFFGRHRDNATPHTVHRRYALTLNLNEDYKGGELLFPEYGPMLYRPPRGAALVFSCALLHEALPVTEGQRFVLLSFFFDQMGARQERAQLQGKDRG